MMNLKTYYQKRLEKYGILGASKIFPYNYLSNVMETPSFFNTTRYIGSSTVIDSMLMRRYGSIKVNDDLTKELDTDDIAFYESYINTFLGFMLEYADDLQRIYDVLTVNYDSFENFNTTRTIETVYGKLTNTDSMGARKTTNKHDKVTTNNTYGASSDTLNYGSVTTTNTKDKLTNTRTMSQQTNTETDGQYQDETLDYVNGYDNGIENNNKRVVTHKGIGTNDITKTVVNGGYTETTTENGLGDNGTINETNTTTPRTDSVSHGARNDVNETLAHNDSVENESYIDKHETDTHTDTITETFKGNQGVSITNQVLVKNEVDLRVSLKFFDIMFNLFLPFISGGVWE